MAVPDLEGKPGLKKSFLALWASVWSKNRGEAERVPQAPTLDPPLLLLLLFPLSGPSQIAALFGKDTPDHRIDNEMIKNKNGQ